MRIAYSQAPLKIGSPQRGSDMCKMEQNTPTVPAVGSILARVDGTHKQGLPMRYFFLSAWLSSSAVISVDYSLTGSTPVGMLVWGAATFAGWAVLVLSGKCAEA